MRPDELDLRADARRHAGGRHDARIRRRDGVRRHASICATSCVAIAAFFRDESCGQCVPCRVGTVRQEEALHRICEHGRGGVATETRAARRGRRRDEGRIDLRPRSDGVCGDRIGDQAAATVRSTERGDERAGHADPIALTRATADRLADDRRPASRYRGHAILDACAATRHHDPDAVLPRDAAPGQRLPAVRRRSRRRARARARAARARSSPGWSVRTRSPRVRARAGRELLASSVDLSTRPAGGAARIRLPPSGTAGAARRSTGCRPDSGHHALRRGTRHRRAAGRKSTTTSTCATTASACSATSASRRAGRITRTRSRLRSPAAASTRASRPNSP